MSARSRGNPATLSEDGTNSLSAPDSALWNIVARLRAHELRGVEVTGTSEVMYFYRTAVGRAKGSVSRIGSNSSGRSQRDQIPHAVDPTKHVWRLQKTADGKPLIEIPADWQIEPDARGLSLTIRWPSRYKLAISKDEREWGARSAGGWKLLADDGQDMIVPEGWIVDTRLDTILAPTGWFFTRDPFSRRVRLAPAPGVKAYFEGFKNEYPRGVRGTSVSNHAHCASKVREIA